MTTLYVPPTAVTSELGHGIPLDSSPLSARTQNTNTLDMPDTPATRQPSTSGMSMSQSQTLAPSKAGTLKKKGSVRRSASRRSLGGSMRSLRIDRNREGGVIDEMQSPFFSPVPSKGVPTELLANRFQDWRKVLKDVLVYFREIQKSHENKAKALHSLSNIMQNMPIPESFMSENGLGDAVHIFQSHHKQSLLEANRAKGVEEDIIVQLTGLRSDLAQKIKEIKSLGGDFKNNVDREMEATKRAVRNLEDALAGEETHKGANVGKNDPFIVRLAVERQIARQIDEENYLHKAFLNLENSGRELESIVVGEIQKAYSAYTTILKREADENYETVEAVKQGPLAMAKDREWDVFIDDNPNFVDPSIALRKPSLMRYPGQFDPAAAEVRAGMLERKSKYLKSYTPGWYVLSATHLHEFKSADRLSSQSPIMSLYLPDQKLGSHSNDGSSSNKFMLKGRQTGGMHRGHGWVFRAESRATMLAWYDAIKNLTERTGADRNEYIRRHARSVSGGTAQPTALSTSSDGLLDGDEADAVPFSASSSVLGHEVGSRVTSRQNSVVVQRPTPGGRFPSDLNVQRYLTSPLAANSAISSPDSEVIVAPTRPPVDRTPSRDARPNPTSPIPIIAVAPPDTAKSTPKGKAPEQRKVSQPVTVNGQKAASPITTSPTAAPSDATRAYQYQAASALIAPAPALVVEPARPQVKRQETAKHSPLPTQMPLVQAQAQSPVQKTTPTKPAGTTTSTIVSAVNPADFPGLKDSSSSLANANGSAATKSSLGGAARAADEELDSAPPTPKATAEFSSTGILEINHDTQMERPGLGSGASTATVSTISGLHVPGEFPRR